ncbi:hypothetical protein HGA88_04550 [Candidatus Roizmanbacteria bacterium]|nr:hypothetical protein [Candidatus Roizmanbacteria bacterium]
MKQINMVSASEIGDFVFCKRGWWLRFNEKLPKDTEEMAAGRAEHESLARRVDFTQRVRLFTIVLLSAGILLGLLLLIIQWFLQ